MNLGGIFLDRDGTINQEVNFLSSPKDLVLLPGSAEAIHETNQLGFKVFVVTNQSGIARGLLTENQLEDIHHELRRQLREYHAHIDAIYYCPHHPEEGDSPFTTQCKCRKPSTGMVEQAVKEFSIDRKRSFVIGDRMIDMQLGNNAGIPSILVLTGYGNEELALCRNTNVQIHYIAPDLHDAVQHIKQVTSKEQLPTS